MKIHAECDKSNKLLCKSGFTLAEVLITLGVIGVVAAITLPSFIGNYQAKVRTEQNRMVQYKLTQATDKMKSLGLIGNYSTTKDFVNVLQKHFKIAQICENDNLEQCWPTKVISTDGTEVKVADIKNGKNMNPTGWTKETLGLITADGTPMILTYKDDCAYLEPEKTYKWSAQDNKPVTNATTSCIAAIYDLNGKSRPNKSGEDVRMFNASKLGNAGFQCIDPYNIGICMMAQDMTFTYMKSETEEYNEFIKSNGIAPCNEEDWYFCSTDYWAGAYKACQDAGGRLPTMSEWVKVSAKVYNNDDITEPFKQYNDNLDPNNKLFLVDANYWTSETVEDNGNISGYSRAIYGDRTDGTYWGRNNNNPLARCVK